MREREEMREEDGQRERQRGTDRGRQRNDGDKQPVASMVACFFFFFKLYIIVLVLPNIKMNPSQVYMCSPS